MRCIYMQKNKGWIIASWGCVLLWGNVCSWPSQSSRQWRRDASPQDMFINPIICVWSDHICLCKIFIYRYIPWKSKDLLCRVLAISAKRGPKRYIATKSHDVLFKVWGPKRNALMSCWTMYFVRSQALKRTCIDHELDIREQTWASVSKREQGPKRYV